MTVYYTFDSKQTYLEARADWKRRYKELCTEQRARKAAIASGLKQKKSVCVLQWDAITHKSKADELMDVLAVMRQEAQLQYMAKR